MAAESNEIEDEMDLLIPFAEKPTAPVRTICNDKNNTTSKGGSVIEKVVSHFFEIIYLPDDPNEEEVRKGFQSFRYPISRLCEKTLTISFLCFFLEIVRKNILIKLKPKPNRNRNNLIMNQSKPTLRPLNKASSIRRQMFRDKIRETETPEETEARRQKQREYNRLSRLRKKHRKLEQLNNQSKPTRSRPPPNKASIRKQMLKEMRRKKETPEETEARKEKERERKRLSRLKMKQEKLALPPAETKIEPMR